MMKQRFFVFCLVLCALHTSLCAHSLGEGDDGGDASGSLPSESPSSHVPPLAKSDIPRDVSKLVPGGKRFTWSYDRSDAMHGPGGWGSLSKSFAACAGSSDGTQSPIDVRAVRADSSLTAPKWTRAVPGTGGGFLSKEQILVKPSSSSSSSSSSSKPMEYALVNSGRGAMEVRFGSGAIVEYGGREWEVTGVRFHSPSEHSIRGMRFPMEAQIATKGSGGGKVIFSTFFIEGEENKHLSPFWNKFPSSEDVRFIDDAAFDMRDLVPKDEQYYTYSGSDSRPPCDDATWVLFKNPLQIGEDQIEQFNLKAGRYSSRNMQPGRNRVVKMSTAGDDMEYHGPSRSKGDMIEK